MDTRVLALMVGVIGAAFGVAAVVSDLPVLGLVAGGAALLAGVVAMLGARPATAAGADEYRTPRSRTACSTPPARSWPSPTCASPSSRPSRPRSPRAAADGAPGAATLTDPSSQLFSEAYFRVALQSRLASARRHLRPVAVCLLEVAEGQPDGPPAPAPAPRVAEAIRETLREADIACRLDDGAFAVILEDTPENGAVWTIERVRRNLVSRFGSHTMWAGVACYPAHAFSAEELLDQARAALAAAQEWKQDRIEVAVAE